MTKAFSFKDTHMEAVPTKKIQIYTKSVTTKVFKVYV